MTIPSQAASDAIRSQPPQDPLRLSRLQPVFRHVRICLSAARRDARLHAAARASGHRGLSAARMGVRFIDENIRPRAAQRFRLGRCRARQRHARAAPRRSSTSRGARIASARRRRSAGPSVSALPELLWRVRLSPCRRTRRRAPTGSIARSTPIRAGRRSRSRCDTGERVPLTDFPVPAYHLAEHRRYFLGSVQFSSGCPYQLRVLRHPGALRPQPAPEDAAAGDRRARRACCERGNLRRGLFRRRQLHRQPPRRARARASIWSMAEDVAAIRSSSPARRRSTSPNIPTSWR